MPTSRCYEPIKMVSIISWWWCCLVHPLCMFGPKAWAGKCVVEIEKWKPFFSFNTPSPVWGLPEFMAQSIFQRDCMQCSYSFIYSYRIHHTIALHGSSYRYLGSSFKLRKSWLPMINLPVMDFPRVKTEQAGLSILKQNGAINLLELNIPVRW